MVLDNVADAFLTEQLLAVSQALKEIETLESTFNSFCDTAYIVRGSAVIVYFGDL
ncbi:hypothetical protein L0F63_002599 [Massospora cicadina]|nr:hypothetical protein L0F63_002599 [Massospora cicadina]